MRATREEQQRNQMQNQCMCSTTTWLAGCLSLLSCLHRPSVRLSIRLAARHAKETAAETRHGHTSYSHHPIRDDILRQAVDGGYAITLQFHPVYRESTTASTRCSQFNYLLNNKNLLHRHNQGTRRLSTPLCLLLLLLR